MGDNIEWLQNWYATKCNGDWEHQFGVSIDTIDNPSWTLSIDLIGSPLAGRVEHCRRTERTVRDWYAWEIRGEKFIAHGGPKNLSDLIGLFRALVDSSAQP